MMRDGQALLRERVVFVFQKGKTCRVEQPSSVIREGVAAVLAGAGAPFEVTLVDSSTRIEAESSALAAWLRSPAFAPLAFVAHAAAAKRVSLEALIMDDAALEAQCGEALGLVRSYEHLRFYSAAQQKAGLADIALRRSVLDAALDWSRRLGLKLDTVHDALQLVQRCSAITSPGGGGGGGGAGGGAGGATGGGGGGGGGGAALLATPMWRLTLAACLMLAARQGEHPASLPGYDAVALATGERGGGREGARSHNTT
jgi:hypothetical protein